MTTAIAPTSDHIRTAVVAAARITREDPMHVYDFRTGIRARHVAYAALQNAFPDRNWQLSAFELGYFGIKEANRLLSSARRSRWWNEDWVDEVVGAIVCDRYGAQAQ